MQEDQDIIDLTSEPDMDEGTEAREGSAHQGHKRKRGNSKQGATDAAVAVASPLPHDPAPADSQPAAAAVPDGLAAMKQQFMCPICHDLVAPAYAVVPCGHTYCGECMAGWLENHKDCPSCRQKCTAPPVRQIAVDSCIDMFASQLGDEDKATREEKKQAWDQGRQMFEQQMRRPFEPSRRPVPGTSGRGMSLQDMQDVLSYGHSFGPFLPAMLTAPYMMQAPAGAPRAPAPPARVPRPGDASQFCCEYAPDAPAQGLCFGCLRAIAPGSLRVGTRSEPRNTREDRRLSFRWYHMDCAPQGFYAAARTHSLKGLRNVSPADQSRLRERMHFTTVV